LWEGSHGLLKITTTEFSDPRYGRNDSRVIDNAQGTEPGTSPRQI